MSFRGRWIPSKMDPMIPGPNSTERGFPVRSTGSPTDTPAVFQLRKIHQSLDRRPGLCPAMSNSYKRRGAVVDSSQYLFSSTVLKGNFEEHGVNLSIPVCFYFTTFSRSLYFVFCGLFCFVFSSF